MKLTISKRLGLVLHAASSGDGKRFAGLFWKTWLRFPTEVREKLVDDWGAWPPTIHLADDWEGRRKWMVGQCAFDTRDIWYFAPAVAALSLPAVQALIAHELVHSFRGPLEAAGFSFRRAQEEELQTHRLVSEYGFEHGQLEREVCDLMDIGWRLGRLPDRVLWALASVLKVGAG